MNKEFRMPDLPESIQEIANVIGRKKALYLVGQLPSCGSRKWRKNLYVTRPENLKDSAVLVRILGREDALKMCEAFAGETLQPASLRNYVVEFTHRMVRKQYAELLEYFDPKKSMDILECRFEYTRRNLLHIISKG